MNKTPILLAALTMFGAIAGIVPGASAERVRGRVVAHGADGGRIAATRAAGTDGHGGYARGRLVASGDAGVTALRRGIAGDGDRNVAGRSARVVYGAHGGEAARRGSFHRNADGSAGRQGSAYVHGRNGGSAHTSGSIARDADGHVDGSRSTQATGANGNRYDATTTIGDGVVVRTATCTSAAGDAIACRGR
ncbi:hypothetical protein [Luteimonas saliphila]|uniref:hypothetical protein n=1 Tax=Luteimonas saliphila TaxID=2804919 RepID=UPI00192D2591|nr:hypothetical protein [Luteimonas saliphila]